MLKFQHVVEDLQNKIISEEFLYDEKLPTESELTDEYGISRQTLRKALSSLQADNYIRSVQGSGYYVTYKAPPKPKTMRIAIITTYISEYIFPFILRDAEKVAANNGFSIQIYATNNSIKTERQILQNIASENIDGILVEGTKTALPNPNVLYYQQLALSGIPIVFFNGYYRDLLDQNIPNIVYVVTDDYAGGVQAIKTLINMGHVDIAGIFKSDDIQGTLRFSGFADAMLSGGADYKDEKVAWFTTETKNTFLNSTENNMSFLDGCSAVVCYNDEITAELLRNLDTKKRSEIDIVSFDNNIDFRSYTDTNIISLGYPKYTVGKTAMLKLINMIYRQHETSCLLNWESI